MASIGCFLDEFKVSVCPPLVFDSSDKVTTLNGLLGRYAPGHMGQGIYYATSTAFHAMVTKEILSKHNEVVKIVVKQHFSLHQKKSLVTSDNVTMFESCKMYSLMMCLNSIRQIITKVNLMNVTMMQRLIYFIKQNQVLHLWVFIKLFSCYF